jgi:hypothetical protein
MLDPLRLHHLFLRRGQLVPLEVVEFRPELILQRLVQTVVAHRVHPFNIVLQQSVLALDPVLNQFLELFQLDLHNDVVHFLVLLLVLKAVVVLRIVLQIVVHLLRLGFVVEEAAQVAVAELADLAWGQSF